MQDTVVIDGELSLLFSGSADCNLLLPESGEVGLITVIREGTYPTYAGPTEITPTEETQVLETHDKSVMSNITVNPIPSNYGLITWDGHKLTVS